MKHQIVLLVRHLYIGLLVCVLLFASAPARAGNDYAADITAECRYHADRNPSGLKATRDGSYETLWKSGSAKAGYIRVDVPEGTTCGGVYLQWVHQAPGWEVQQRNAAGKWETVARSDTHFLSDFLAFPPISGSLRIRTSKRSGEIMRIAEMRLFAPGEPPPDVQRWQPPVDKADLLLIHAHPDDEVLFMGGVLPLYAGERRMRVQVLCLVPSMYYRKLELLDSLWHCGVRSYPVMANMGDNYATSLKKMYEKWSRKKLCSILTEAVRRFQPDVVVTHDLEGEYGHGAHRAAADATIAAIGYAADKRADRDSEKAYGLWSVQKLYLHLYPENVLRMDWRKPLKAFDDKTAFDIASEAYGLHRSQQSTEYRVEDFGPYDNSLFGLYYSSVGSDTLGGDFFENVTSDTGDTDSDKPAER